MTTELSIKVDVDSDRGTRLGVPALLDLFDSSVVMFESKKSARQD